MRASGVEVIVRDHHCGFHVRTEGANREVWAAHDAGQRPHKVEVIHLRMEDTAEVRDEIRVRESRNSAMKSRSVW